MTRKTAYFEWWLWFKFNNLGLTLGTNFKLYTSVAKRLKVKVRKFWGLIPLFVEVTGEKLIGARPFCPPPPIILNWVNQKPSSTMSVMLCTGATFVKKNSCLVARIVSFYTAGLHLLTFLILEPLLSKYILI